MRRGEVTLCPECGAQDSLYQRVWVKTSGERPVWIEGPEANAKVAVGPADIDPLDTDVVDEEEIQCSRCKATWATEKELFDLGPPIEHRCTGCSWWGYNDFNHGLQQPDCAGLVYRVDKPPAEVAA